MYSNDLTCKRKREGRSLRMLPPSHMLSGLRFKGLIIKKYIIIIKINYYYKNI